MACVKLKLSPIISDDNFGIPRCRDTYALKLINNIKKNTFEKKHELEAWKAFNSKYHRELLDSFLFKYESVESVCDVLLVNNKMLDIYSKWFFDIDQINTPELKYLYINNLNDYDQQKAFRTILSYNTKDIKYMILGNSEDAEESKEAAKSILAFSIKMFRGYNDVKIEDVISGKLSNKDIIGTALKYGALALKSIDVMQKYGMDANKEEFMKDIMIKLKSANMDDHIRPASDDLMQEYHSSLELHDTSSDGDNKTNDQYFNDINNEYDFDDG